MLSVTEMDNVFITKYFKGWKPKKLSRKIRFANKVFEKLGYSVQLMPIRTGAMTSVEQRINMFHLAAAVLVYGVPGDFVEIGCNAGQTAILFKKIIEHYDKSRTLHVYDSFEGLPEVAPGDANIPVRKGSMNTIQQALLNNFAHVGVEPPIIHQGWFKDTLPTQLPGQIAFAHLDGDLYESTRVGLDCVYPKLSKGAVCLIDDYCDPAVYDIFDAFPGVKRACDEFLRDKPEKIAVMLGVKYGGGGIDERIGYGSHGFFRKL